MMILLLSLSVLLGACALYAALVALRRVNENEAALVSFRDAQELAARSLNLRLEALERAEVVRQNAVSFGHIHRDRSGHDRRRGLDPMAGRTADLMPRRSHFAPSRAYQGHDQPGREGAGHTDLPDDWGAQEAREALRAEDSAEADEWEVTQELELETGPFPSLDEAEA